MVSNIPNTNNLHTVVFFQVLISHTNNLYTVIWFQVFYLIQIIIWFQEFKSNTINYMVSSIPI